MLIKNRKNSGFLLLETLLALFIFISLLSFSAFSLKNLSELNRRIKEKIFSRLLAGNELERILGADFSEIVSFKTGQKPADPWSTEIASAPLASAEGEVQVAEINPYLKKVTVTLAYQSGEKKEAINLETLVVN